MGAISTVFILGVMEFLGILSNVDFHMTLTSWKPGAHSKSLSQSTMERQDSTVGNVPKYFSRAEAKRVSIARWKNAQ